MASTAIRIADFYTYASTVTTLRPRYIPQLGQAWWFWRGAPHSGHVATEASSAFFCARRIRTRIFDFFLFGTAIFNSDFLYVLTFLSYKIPSKASHTLVFSFFLQEHLPSESGLPHWEQSPLQSTLHNGWLGRASRIHSLSSFVKSNSPESGEI